MIELKRDSLVFSFPQVSRDATLSINFQRTLRIPDDEKTYPLPPGLGSFPLRHVDDYAKDVPSHWLERGGVMLPMYQSEAMWLHFNAKYVGNRLHDYPFAVKIATGKINAVTGDSWTNALRNKPQDYLVAPPQPWLDGYAVQKGIIRQFVAMPLGSGYSAEEQLTGEAKHGGLQIIVYPMKREVFERRYPEREIDRGTRYCVSALPSVAMRRSEPDMGLAPGGKMKQTIYDDPFDFDDWDTSAASRCFVHIANSLVWRQITGSNPPTTPPTATEYTRARLPWFDYYDDDLGAAVGGGAQLGHLKSVATLGVEKDENPLPENEAVTPGNIITLRKHMAKDQVREGRF